MSGPVHGALLWAGRGLGLLLGGFGLWHLGADAVRSIDAGTISLKPLGRVWYEIDPASLNLLQAGVERHLSPKLWDAIAVLLSWPAWILPLALAALLAVLTWPRRRG